VTIEFFKAGNSLCRDNTHLICGVGHKKIIGAIEPSLMVLGVDNRRHAIMDFSNQLIRWDGDDTECPVPISCRVRSPKWPTLQMAVGPSMEADPFPCSRPHPTEVRCSLLLTVLISKPVALIATMFPNDKNGMRVKPLPVSKEAAQRSGGLPTLTPFR
jgi:hypothetical protein